LAHTYSSITKSDNTYKTVSDVTPEGTAEEKFTWVTIVPNQDTWLELLINGGKVHWCDWYYGTAFIDAWTSLTNPDYTYTSVSPIHSDSFINLSIWSYWASISVLTWNNAYTIGKTTWLSWAEVETEYNYQSLTTPSHTYSEVTV